MAKDNSKENSDLLQRLKLLLAESDKRQSIPPEGKNQTNQASLEEALHDILSSPEKLNQESREEEVQGISTGDPEIQQSTPTEEINQESREETTPEPSSPSGEIKQEIRGEEVQDISISGSEIQQSAPTEEINQESREEATRNMPLPTEESDQEGLQTAPPDISDTESEIRQDEPPEELKKEPLGKVELDDQFKNTLKEGVIMPQVGNYVVNYKNIIVKTSDGSVITGKTNIDAFGRLTEYLKQGTDKFITVFSEEAGDKSKQVTIVNKDHIIWANTWD
ncbi:MAG: hypothetical protein A4E74_00776 [Syntrophus sp. PtaB.Bin075]|nr:MAG: hypothetical protein A4E74_00776 [Syntrophus sp. PtaB.Bin075]